MIKHIVFDFGGVFLDLDGVHTGYPDDLALIFDVPVEQAKQIWSNNKTLVMTGKENPRDFLQRMKAELKLAFDVDESLAFWEKRNAISPDRLDWDLIDKLEHLKENYQVHMLTDQISLDNGAKDWITKVEKHFHTIFRSYEQGFRKPDHAAYHNVLTKIQASDKPASVVFIDDAPMNVAAANEVGINGVLYSFRDHASLKDELQKLGVNWN